MLAPFSLLIASYDKFVVLKMSTNLLFLTGGVFSPLAGGHGGCRSFIHLAMTMPCCIIF